MLISIKRRFCQALLNILSHFIIFFDYFVRLTNTLNRGILFALSKEFLCIVFRQDNLIDGNNIFFREVDILNQFYGL